MTAKQYLNQIRLLAARIRHVEDEIERIHEEAAAYRSMWPDGQPHGTGTTDPTGTTGATRLDRKIEIESEYRRLLLELHLRRQRVIVSLGRVTNFELHEVLMLRYVEGLRFEEIAVKMGYSYRHAIRLHGKALQAYEEVVPHGED